MRFHFNLDQDFVVTLQFRLGVRSRTMSLGDSNFNIFNKYRNDDEKKTDKDEDGEDQH